MRHLGREMDEYEMYECIAAINSFDWKTHYLHLGFFSQLDLVSVT